MKLSNFDLFKLPYVDLTQLELLPTCSAIYFAIDSQNRVLYVGLSLNLLQRWKTHHRLHQLKEIHENSLDWEIFCNGVILDVTPIDRHDFKLLRNKENSSWKKLAGIKIRAIENFNIVDDYRFSKILNDSDSNLSILKNDPIPLLWTNNS